MSSNAVESGEAIEVSALLRTRGQSINGLTVYFYDGDPQDGGKIFDIERVPFVRARDAYLVSTSFRAEECGRRRIFVKAAEDREYEISGQSRVINVKCAKPPQCETNCFRSPEYYSNNLWSGLPKGEV